MTAITAPIRSVISRAWSLVDDVRSGRMQTYNLAQSVHVDETLDDAETAARALALVILKGAKS